MNYIHWPKVLQVSPCLVTLCMCVCMSVIRFTLCSWLFHCSNVSMCPTVYPFVFNDIQEKKKRWKWRIHGRCYHPIGHKVNSETVDIHTYHVDWCWINWCMGDKNVHFFHLLLKKVDHPSLTLDTREVNIFVDISMFPASSEAFQVHLC